MKNPSRSHRHCSPSSLFFYFLSIFSLYFPRFHKLPPHGAPPRFKIIDRSLKLPGINPFNSTIVRCHLIYNFFIRSSGKIVKFGSLFQYCSFEILIPSLELVFSSCIQSTPTLHLPRAGPLFSTPLYADVILLYKKCKIQQTYTRRFKFRHIFQKSIRMLIPATRYPASL